MKSMKAFRSLTTRSLLQNQMVRNKSYTFKLDGDWTIEQAGREDFTGPNKEVTHDKETLLDIFKLMVRIREFEKGADAQYKKKNIRGFCHLYSGQEAVLTGCEIAGNYGDPMITAYRCHGHQIARGDTMDRCMAELFGKHSGCAKGKGGSMHMYFGENNFFGGNGIVGAQVPVGTGNALALLQTAKREKRDNENVSWVYMGDGASNQGQVYEAYNMAKLWNLPVVYIIENNKYGMGTSISRSSASTNFYAKGHMAHIPGIRANGMDVINTHEVARYAKEYAIKNGPIILELETYRYYGHSMSDPGYSYRTRDEINNVRKTMDPINLFKIRTTQDQEIFTAEELKAIEKEAKAEVKDAVKHAEESAEPADKEFVSDILVNEAYSVRGRSVYENYSYDPSN